jgi:hypothetical protein
VTLLATLLTAGLGSGFLAGLVALLRLRTDKGAVSVETASKSLLILERLNDRLERDLSDERAARIKAETERDELRRLQYPTRKD